MTKTDAQNNNSSTYLINWFIRLRWIACVVAFVLVLLTVKVFHYLQTGTMWPLFALIAVLAMTNLTYSSFIRKKLFVKYLKEIQIVTDLLILTLMLHFSGGIENPLAFVFLFHVILGGILLEKRKCYGIVALAFVLYASLALFELSGVVSHYTLQIFPHTHSEQHVHGDAGHHHGATEDAGDDVHASHYAPYVWSMILLTLFLLVLTAYFTVTIMDRLRAEEKSTREERQRLEHVLQATGAGLLILDESLRPVWYNAPVKNWLGINSNGAGRQMNIFNDWIEGADGAAAATFADGSIRSIERERIVEPGQKQFFQITVAPLKDADGSVYQVVELIQDISEKKIIEAEMLHAAKMVTLGTMSAGIAHEVGNPLASISTRLQLLEVERDEAFIAQSIRLLQKEISRIERIVRGISQFGRPSGDGWAPCPVNQLLCETVEMLKYHKHAKRSRIETEFDENLPDTLGVRDQLKQIFLNLGLNALEAMSDTADGVLTIRSRVEKGNIKIEFIDNGGGISQADREKIFQPFFTTKEKGSGLGLFIVNHIVQAHSGRIIVSGQPGKGAAFTIFLPIHSTKRRIHKRKTRKAG